MAAYITQNLDAIALWSRIITAAVLAIALAAVIYQIRIEELEQKAMIIYNTTPPEE